ncbi:T9SS type A sorting domain-containing protein [Rhodohalobacter sp. 8-1]|uniref:T9SS type A sorting domain-containing protein n=1 Tax=Rhodohalobacter sp. 8-1 TaxID=3131972 RepID=UPI0030EBD885
MKLVSIPRGLVLSCVMVLAGSYSLQAQLPQNHAYQVELRNFMGSLSEEDFDVELRPLTFQEAYFDDGDKVFRSWILRENRGRNHPTFAGLSRQARYFTLSEIERGGEVYLDVGRGQFVSPIETAWWAGWDYPGNPYYNHEGVKLRAAVAAMVDMMMLERYHEDGKGRRSDFAGTNLLRYGYTYSAVKDVLPEPVRAAFEEGMVRLFSRIEEWGPTLIHADMDQFAVAGVWAAAESMDSDDLRRRAREYVAGVYEGAYHEAGYIDHGGGFDPSYQGITFFFASWAALLSDDPFLKERLSQMSKLKAHLSFPEPDEKWTGPSHFATSNDAGSPNDQWGPLHRDIGVGMISDEAKYLLWSGKQRPHWYLEGLPEISSMLWEIESDFRRMSNRITDDGVSDRTPATWSENHWTNGPMAAQEYYMDGAYRAYKDLLDSNSPLMKAPMERDEQFSHQFGDDFLIAKRDNFGLAVHTGQLSRWGSETKISGLSGGGISAFWTKETGSVILGLQKGFQNSTTGPDKWEEWRIWPVHAISGETAAGQPFSSARQKRPKSVYAMNEGDPSVQVSGAINDDNAAPDNAITGEMSYHREFTVKEDGVRVHSRVESDGTDELRHLYEMIPIYLGDRQELNVEIFFKPVTSTWVEATADPVENVMQVRVDRFEGSIIIEFDEPQTLQLSPEVWTTRYQTRSRARNVMVSLLNNNSTDEGLNYGVVYSIYSDRDYNNDSEVEAPPDFPGLLSPEDGTTGTSRNPKLSWKQAIGADNYGLRLAKDSGFEEIVIEQNGISQTTYELESLDFQTTYYWQVTARNEAGTSNWSQGWRFTTRPEPPAQPSAPQIVSPADGSTMISIHPVLNWQASEGGERYGLRVATDSGFRDVVIAETGITGGKFKAENLDDETTYYWQVTTMNSAGISEWSQGWRFTTRPAPAVLPSAPELASPADGSTTISINPVLNWQAAEGGVSYGLRVATDSGFRDVVIAESGITGGEFKAEDLDYETTYYWQVTASNEAGTGDWSQRWKFTTPPEPPAQTSAPHLGSPADGSTTISIHPVLNWQASEGGERYGLRVATDSIFSDVVIAETGMTSGEFKAEGLDYETTYYWQVNAGNEAGTSDWSQGWRFTTRPEPPAQPSAPHLGSPEDGSTTLSINPVLTWQASEGGERYGLRVAKDSVFRDMVMAKTGMTGGEFKAEGLDYETTYYWQLTASNEAGTSDWSQGWRFTTGPEPPVLPSAPHLGSPADGSTTISTNPVLNWQPSGQSQRYGLRVATDSVFSDVVIAESGITGVEFKAEDLDLDYETTYYWQVTASNEAGTSDWSQGWRFTTRPEPAAQPSAPDLASPGLLSPEDGTTGSSRNPVLSWQAAKRGEIYGLRVATDSVFSDVVIDETWITGGEFKAEDLNYETTYYWQVNAMNSAGLSDWSQGWKFTTRPEPVALHSAAQLVSPGLLSPGDGTTGTSRNPVLNWQAAEGDVSYRLRVATDSLFSDVVIAEAGIAGGEFKADGLAHETTYYWQVTAMNEAGTSDWSQKWSFITESDDDLVDEIVLMQNYPNPFNPNTTIIFRVDDNQHVTLNVYDLNGRLVSTLYDGVAASGGLIEVTFNALNLSSGIYIYRLIIGSEVITKRMTLIK